MGDVTLIRISDPHLSREWPFFLGNWRRLVVELESVRPDAIVASGDLSVDGASADDDLAFAASEIAQLPAPLVKVVAGNHDIGEASPDNPAGETIDEARRTRFQRHFGAEWWEEELGGWVLIHHLHENGSHTHEMVRSPALAPNDLAAIKGHGRYTYLKDMPPDAVVEAMARLAIC